MSVINDRQYWGKRTIDRALVVAEKNHWLLFFGHRLIASSTKFCSSVRTCRNCLWKSQRKIIKIECFLGGPYSNQFYRYLIVVVVSMAVTANLNTTRTSAKYPQKSRRVVSRGDSAKGRSFDCCFAQCCTCRGTRSDRAGRWGRDWERARHLRHPIECGWICVYIIIYSLAAPCDADRRVDPKVLEFDVDYYHPI